MPHPQHGIFALGTASHTYLELDAHADPRAVVKQVATLWELSTTIRGVNLVAGFSPKLWRAVAPEDTPGELTGFGTPVIGDDGFQMPATQHDLLLWVSGSSYDVVFDLARDMIATLGSLASVAQEVASWPYHHDRDLTGFIDGTENPSLAEAPDVALVPEGTPGAGGSVLLLQKWSHDAAWEALPVAEQERIMGRTKPDSTELADRAADSHVARTDQDELGKVFRRNMPYGTVDDHGTMFVGFSSEQSRLHRMLERMAGCGDGVRDALTRFTQPLTGSYYFVPSLPSLRRFTARDQATGSSS